MTCISHHNACECREALHRKVYQLASLFSHITSDYDLTPAADRVCAERTARRLAQVQAIGVELGYINPTTEGEPADD